MKLDHGSIEKKWQEKWEGEWKELFEANDTSKKPKCYLLVEFPYPSGEGLHMGHPRSYVAMDIVARKRRMEGQNVLYPIGWDAFGLPAENFAIKTGQHPRKTVEKNVDNFRRQLKSLGISFDWSREVNTTDPEYYKWTQWMFLQFFKHGLSYKAKMPINWCLSCKIGLANEEVVEGKCERCGGEIEKRDKEQWMIRITKYADQLLKDLDTVDYLPRIQKQQEDWIGRSEGAEIDFPIDGHDKKITVFTTRPDTLFGATYMVLAPEHLLVSEITTSEHRAAVDAYVKESKKKTDIERGATEKEKTGVFTGAYCINPANNEKIPVWVADYVMMGYGTGAIMAVPAHDDRDCDFAARYELSIRYVIEPKDEAHSRIWEMTNEKFYIGPGSLKNSGKFNGLSDREGGRKIIETVGGRSKVQYKLRDWVFSRQRYWGEPIPIIHCEKCGEIAVPEKDLPVLLPEVEKYQPTDTGESPLAAIDEWVNVECPKCGGAAKRETDVMPNWAGSSWYFLRYTDPQNDKAFASKKALKKWMPVDWYNGGMEHTTLHLLYSRFWNKFFHDIGFVPKSEPYAKRTSHGLILAEDGEKMSKSRGNVINPDEIVKEYGADTMRCYEMFIGPFDQAVPWNQNGVIGVRRFLEKIWVTFQSSGIIQKEPSAEKRQETSLHQTIKKVSEDIEAMKFNTAVAQMMKFVGTNGLCREKEEDQRRVREIFVRLLSPFAPHLSEELWERLGHKDSVITTEWPIYDETLAAADEIELVVQINGKVRDTFTVPAGLPDDKLKEKALASEKIQIWLDGKEPKKVIIVKGKLVSIVV
jgi:leucyl-tRNA synthetase